MASAAMAGIEGNSSFAFDDQSAKLHLTARTRTGDIGGAIFIDGYSGGAMLTVLNSTIMGNTAGTMDNGGSGAGIYSSADALTIIDSTISNNTAWIGGIDLSGGNGGGINNENGTLNISNTTISSNGATAIQRPRDFMPLRV